MRRRAAWLALLVLPALASAAEVDALPPSAIALLAPRLLSPAFLDAAPLCTPHAAADREGSRARGPVAKALWAVRDTRDGKHLAEVVREHSDADPREVFCAHLELARLHLMHRRAPQARVALRRAEALGPPARPELEEIAQFYTSEAYALAGDWEAAAPILASLRASENRNIALAARLRSIQREIDAPDPDADASRRDSLFDALDEAQGSGVDVSSWAPFAAELAIADGSLRVAHRWLALAERIENDAGVTSIRKSDVLVALGRGEDARQLLDRVRQTARRKDARKLALVRLAELGVPESIAERAAILRSAESSEHPSVVASARDALAALLLEAGDLPGALGALSQLGHDGAPDAAKPRFAQTLASALATATREQTPCVTVVGSIGGRRDLFLRLSTEPGPLLRLGDCFLALGMPEASADLYRGLARRFPIAPHQLALRIAKASFALGDRAALRAALRARASGEAGSETASWLWLEVRLAIVEGDTVEAGRRLVDLLERSDLPAPIRIEAERELVDLAGSELSADTLRTVLLSSLAIPLPEAPPGERAAAWLGAADLLADERLVQAARAAYLRAAEMLPSGARRARAIYAAESSGPDRSGSDETRMDDEDSAATPWAQLAVVDRKIARLREVAHAREDS